MKKNYLSFQVLIFVSISLLIFGLLRLQVFRGAEFKDDTSKILSSIENLGVERGRIIDSKGNILAEDIEASYLLINNLELLDISQIDSLVSTGYIDPILGEDLEVGLEIPLRKDLEVAIEGTEIINRYVRKYNNPLLFSNIVGYVGNVDAQALESDSFYEYVDRIGKTHIEKYFEEELRGTKGFIFSNGSQSIEEKGIRGNDVSLTIDSRWQKALSNILLKYKNEHNTIAATGLIMDSSSGAITTMAEVPTYNSNDLTSLSEQEYKKLSEDLGRPLLNKNIGFRGAPGSIFKVITAYELFENSGVTSSQTVFSNRCINLSQGVDFCEFDRNFYGTVDLERALTFSSNIYFCELLRTRKEFQTFENSQKLLGLTMQHTLPLDGGTVGTIDGPSQSKSGWFLGDTCNAAIGQGRIQTTPFNALLFASAVLNEGKVKEPYIIKEIRDPFGNTLQEHTIDYIIDVESRSNAFSEIRRGMWSAVNNTSSAIYPIFSDYSDYNIHGKTGTAESSYLENGNFRETIHGWFIGEFTYKNTPYTFVFHLHHGGGGYNTTFILRDFLECLETDFNGELCR